LWFEEMIGGDETKKMADIMENLDRADWYAKAMIEGGEKHHLKLWPLKEKILHDKISDLQKQLITQRELILKRINLKNHSGPGSGIDKIYHSKLEKFISDAIIFEMEVKTIVGQNFKIFKYISIGVFIFYIFLFLIVGYSFYRYDSLRRKNYSEIVEMHEILLQKEKMAALGTMTASIAHEVNNPNSFITLNMPILKGYIGEIWDVLEKCAANNLLDLPYEKLRENLQKTIENIENGSNRITRIVSTLKNFSKRKHQTKKSWFKISDTINSVVKICGAKLEFLVYSFEVNIAEDVPEKILFDPEVLEICLINLLNNAAEAIDKQKSWIRLNVYANSSKEGKDSVIIEVKDNGYGINNSDMEKIFKPFFSTKTSSGGTGLGLYLCHILIQQAGGSIEAESKVGVGSVFRLVI
jgi:signal transduction histidine kinase